MIFSELGWKDPKLDNSMRKETSNFVSFIRQELSDADTAGQVQQGGKRDVTASCPSAEKLKSVFGENLPRLQKAKKKYDPTFMWDKWCPIPIEAE